MAGGFENIGRDTPMLLPPDLRDWVGEDDLPCNATGLRGLMRESERSDRPAMICEARGGGKRKLVADMHQGEVAVSVVNPALVRCWIVANRCRPA